MRNFTHKTLCGRRIEVGEFSEPVSEFLDAAFAAADDPRVSADQMTQMVYGPTNPLLVVDPLTGSAWMTPDTFADPVYFVLVDLIGRKRVSAGEMDMEAVRRQYTVTVPDAARRLGITQQGVRVAIHARRLSAVFHNGEWRIHPNSLASFRVSRRGRPKKPAAKAPA